MQDSTKRNDAFAARVPAVVPTVRKGGKRSLVLVVGSGRSGTSLFAGTLQRLGFHVPQPEVPADHTNPRGFAESKWVVDFHTRLLRRARVQLSDARPSAWSKTAQVGLDENVRRELREWLDNQFRLSDDMVIKDPRLSWFLPLWQRCADEIGAVPGFVTVLRHPAAVVDSKQRSYGGWQGEVSRTAGWVNLVLFTERATRDAPRVYVRYDDLLDDWTSTVAGVAEALDLRVVRDASPVSMRRVHEFVDRSLSRSRSGWEDFDIPDRLREQADEVWELVSALADEGTDAAAVERLDAARAAYIELYEDAEAIAESSIAAVQRRQATAPERVSGGALTAVRRLLPRRVRRKIPLHWRRAVVVRLQANRR
jgi:hypothetical protein